MLLKNEKVKPGGFLYPRINTNGKREPFNEEIVMKRIVGILGCLVLLWIGSPQPFVGAAEMSEEELLNEIHMLRDRIQRLEQILEERLQPVQEEMGSEAFTPTRMQDARIVRKLEHVSREQEEMKSILDRLADRVSLSGLVELEASYERLKHRGDGDTEEDSRFTLATAQLDVDARIHEYVNAHLLFLYEEGETDPIDVDEATITLGATEMFPFYLLAGRFYPHIGDFTTWFVSDPLTLELGEMRHTAVSAGWLGSWIHAAVGVFNGDVSDRDDDHINSYWIDVQVFNPEGALGPFQFNLGAGYTNNFGDTDTLREEVPDQRLEDLVAGFSLYGTVAYGPLSLTAEYLGALDRFNTGELAFAVVDGEFVSARPRAWNVELAYTFLDSFLIAAKYEGTKDLFHLLPRTQFGGVFGWEFLPGVTWSVEYLRGEFASNDEELDTRDLVTTQLAVTF